MKRSPYLNSSGFTIVETLFVLAIAGLIFLIIFLSLPALIHNGRNNQRKEDVTNILSAVSRWQLNNSGTNFPPACPGAGCVTALLQNTGTKLSLYDPTDITINVDAANGAAVTSVAADKVQLDNFHVCKPGIGGATSVAAGYRDVTAVFQIETGSGTAIQCLQL